MAKSLEQFADFVLATNTHIKQARTESGVLQEVQNQTNLTGRLMKGKSASQTIKSGKSITTYSQFAAGTQDSYYQPGEVFVNAIEDFTSQLTFKWRYLHSSFSYAKQELILNENGRDDAGISAQNIDLLKNRRQGQRTGMWNTIESAWWTAPSLATMETAATATRPQSIRSYITEDGLIPSVYSTLAGTSNALYRNQVSPYTTGAIETTLKPAMANMLRKINFEAAPTMTAYWEDTKFNKCFITTDINGAGIYQSLTEAANDRLVGSGKDLGAYAGNLSYNNIEVAYIKQMDSIGYATNAPRFFWINSDYLYPVWHTQAYFDEEKPMNDVVQPWVYTVHVDTWMQLICPSRQRLGINGPG